LQQTTDLQQALAPIHHMPFRLQEITQAFTQDGIVFQEKQSHAAAP
jgi:hypothetical protein